MGTGQRGKMQHKMIFSKSNHWCNYISNTERAAPTKLDHMYSCLNEMIRSLKCSIELLQVATRSSPIKSQQHGTIQKQWLYCGRYHFLMLWCSLSLAVTLKFLYPPVFGFSPLSSPPSLLCRLCTLCLTWSFPCFRASSGTLMLSSERQRRIWTGTAKVWTCTDNLYCT